jgi:hypothetical protein
MSIFGRIAGDGNALIAGSAATTRFSRNVASGSAKHAKYREALRRLTKLSSVGKVVQGRANGPFLLAALRWEVVQLAVHQILEPI